MFAASIQGESFSKKQVSKRPRYNEGLTPHGRTYLWAWVLCAGPCFPLAFLSGSWAHATQDSLLWGTVPSMGNVAQPPLGKASGERVGGQDPHPRIGSPVGNQACIVPRPL